MRNLYYLYIIFILLSGKIFSQGTGFVTLDGRQFKDGIGNDFYPKVIGYSYHILYNTNTPDSFYLSASNSYDAGISCVGCDSLPNLEYEYDNQTDCLNQIHNHMLKIKDMGFNAIRTHDFAAFKDTSLNGTFGFYFVARENKGHPIYNNHTKKVYIDPPYDTLGNTNRDLLFSFWDLILHEADSCGLKVLIDVAYGPAKPMLNVNDYTDFLMAVAERFRNNTALMGYVIIEEPHPDQYDYNKQKICEITTQWYDAIRAIDTNHLITAGGNSVQQDILLWDPAVMKIDFFSPHPYPDVLPIEGMDYDKAIDRVHGQLKWLGNNCPKPWMPGETSFSAINDHRWLPPYIRSPDGTLQQQADYAQFMQDAVLSYGGSGLTWWIYQENWWDIWQDGYGLLDHSNNDKPAVDKFRNYHRENLPPLLNYYNPMNFPSSAYTYTGTVINEETGLPVKDAVISAWIDYYIPVPDTPGGFIGKSYVIYTFSNDSGYYALHTLHPEAYIDVINGYTITVKNITVTASGSEREKFGDWFYLLTPGDTTCYLKTPASFDKNVSSETINSSNSIRSFEGYRTLTAQNITIEDDGESILKAGKEVIIKSEFYAKQGGEVHIYCEQPNFSDCINDLSNFKRKGISTAGYNDILTTKEIQINFISKQNSEKLHIIPNPNEGIFEIQLGDNSNSIWKINIFDIYGKILFSQELKNYSTQIDLSFLPKGIYLIKGCQQNNCYSNKIIIQ